MKLAATLTSSIMDGIVQLPGVPTLDWADRVARSVSRIHHPSMCAAFIGKIDGRGFVQSMELTGSARSKTGTSAPSQVPEKLVEEPADQSLDMLRGGFRIGEWLGWPTESAPDQVSVHSASQLGLLRRAENPIWRRWTKAGPMVEIVGAIVPVPNSSDGRVVLIEIGITSTAGFDLARTQAVLTAVMPLVSIRVLRAIGVDGSDHSDWLTPREEVVLWQLLSGKKVPQIAAELNRSVYTVHDHVKSLHRKLGAKSRGELVAKALGHLAVADEPLSKNA